MKVVILNNLYREYARGGAEKVVWNQANDLADKGDEVHVITTVPLQFRTLFGIHRVKDGSVTVHQYTPLNVFSYANIGRFPKFLRMIWHTVDLLDISSQVLVGRLLRKISPDIVYTHNLKGMGMRTILSSSKYNHVHVLHDVQLITPSGLLMVTKMGDREVVGVLARFYRKVLQRYFSKVKAVWGQSQWIIDIHKQFGFFENASAEKHPVGVLTESTPMARQEEQNPRILFVGQIEQHKGVEVLLQAFEQVRESKPEAQLIVVGDGSQRAVLEKRFGDERIHWVGKCTPEEAKKYYQQAGVLVVPSLCHENRPNVIIEAKQFGIPVVASRSGGIPELIDQGDVLVPPGDVLSLAKGVLDKI